jgi:importin subunit alpha-1
MVTGDEVQTDHVIQCGCLPIMLQLLSNNKRNIRKEACWTLSNITAGTASQIQALDLPLLSQACSNLLQSPRLF